MRPHTVLLAASLALTAGPAIAAPTAIQQAFERSDVVRRLDALGTHITDTLDLGNRELLAVDYVPKQGALSEWDDESRLVLYHWDASGTFTREQFVSKAGQSVPGRLAGLVAADLDHDGTPEVLAIGFPQPPSHRVTSQIYRRGGPGARFELVWNRRDHGAAFRTDVPGAAFVYYSLDPETFQPKVEAYNLTGGQLVPTEIGRK